MEKLSFDYAGQYARLHELRPKWFSGKLSGGSADEIARLVKETGAASLLDYGSGKGYQYLRGRIHMAWGGILPHCYDPGVRQLSAKPEGKFDGVICTDVMEHIAKPDIDAVLADIFGYAEKFVYFNICVRRSKKHFSDGQQIHLTVQPPEWWEERLNSHRRDGLLVKADYENKAWE